jgi:hypothetical protein
MYYSLMGPQSYKLSVVDRKVVMRLIPVLTAGPRRCLVAANLCCNLTFVRGKRYAKKVKHLLR